MDLHRSWTVLRWVFSRMGLVYLAIFVSVISLVDIKAVEDRIKIRRLNDTRPEMDDLVSFNNGTLSADRVNWQAYIKYFSLVLKYMPFEKVSRMFLGYCEYYSKDPHKTAFEHIQRAADEPPLVYWGAYNAGMLLFERGDMSNAVRYFERGISLPTEIAEHGIMSSIIYRQVMAAPSFSAVIPAEINASREDLYFFLSAAYYYLKEYEKSKNVALYAIQQLAPKDPEPFYFYAGASSLAMNDAQNALVFLSQCMARQSRNPLAYLLTAEILKTVGKNEEAQVLLRTAEILKAKRTSGFPYPEKIRLRLF